MVYIVLQFDKQSSVNDVDMYTIHTLYYNDKAEGIKAKKRENENQMRCVCVHYGLGFS